MKVYLLILFTCCFVFLVKAQNNNVLSNQSKSYKLLRSNIGIAGSSKTIATSNGNYKISQSIGQSSVIGTNYNKGYYLRQGYQQPSSNIEIIKEYNSHNLKATIYPNPFEKSVSISFNETIDGELSFLIYDISGKVIYSRKFNASQYIELNLSNISQGTYLLKVLSKNKIFNTKLIKI